MRCSPIRLITVLVPLGLAISANGAPVAVTNDAANPVAGTLDAAKDLTIIEDTAAAAKKLNIVPDVLAGAKKINVVEGAVGSTPLGNTPLFTIVDGALKQVKGVNVAEDTIEASKMLNALEDLASVLKRPGLDLVDVRFVPPARPAAKPAADPSTPLELNAEYEYSSSVLMDSDLSVAIHAAVDDEGKVIFVLRKVEDDNSAKAYREIDEQPGEIELSEAQAKKHAGKEIELNEVVDDEGRTVELRKAEDSEAKEASLDIDIQE
ncbi:hypothetical protein BJ508DRAFT_302175 [Ascobolus immersus RN42]|uniref:Uncharacterized protein n=1 Tax=Ascobolus immersus RN42 TaxID=1160509 RepID=A0A3N4IJF1_ASCIM|nr:hypothetical protein BJ508DRAFT_302175 [Ascobolus immersus RN42]